MTASPRVVVYIRVSTVDQKPALQVDEVHTYAQRRGWTILETYEDIGVSGSKERRPGLDKLLDDARHRKFDVLLVWKSDRLFRSLHHMVKTLQEFGELGVDFVSATEVFDTSTPQGRLLFHLLAAFGEFERATIVERVRAGMAAARKRGKPVGRKPKVFDSRTVQVLSKSGLSIRDIAKRFPNVSRSTIARCLKKMSLGQVASG